MRYYNVDSLPVSLSVEIVLAIRLFFGGRMEWGVRRGAKVGGKGILDYRLSFS